MESVGQRTWKHFVVVGVEQAVLPTEGSHGDVFAVGY